MKKIILFFAVLFTLNVFAHEQETLFNVVNLQANAEAEVENDEMLVMLMVEHEGKNAADLADMINKEMDWALKQAKKYTDVEAETRSYNTYPIYKKTNIIGWRASQQLHLNSENIEILTELLGKLQEKLKVKQMSFVPTRETRLSAENGLIEEAMQAFKQRVEIVKKGMAEKNYRIINLNINSGSNYSQPMYMRQERSKMASMDSVAAPAVSSGTSKVTVTVSGSVQFF